MREFGIRGYSLTIPHKEAAIPLVDELDDEAKSIGSVNTIINDGGVLRGRNTDWLGITGALKESGFKPSKLPVLLFGAGGAARAALYALRRIGVESLLISNRSAPRAEALAKEFSASVLPFNELSSFDFGSISLFVNSSPIGSDAADAGASYPFPMSVFSKNNIVFDMVTSKTEMLRSAEASGARTIQGIRMLLHQAVPQFKQFTALEDAPTDVMEKALIEEFSRPG
jgi:shikimate dehydrogenase